MNELLAHDKMVKVYSCSTCEITLSDFTESEFFVIDLVTDVP